MENQAGKKIEKNMNNGMETWTKYHHGFMVGLGCLKVVVKPGPLGAWGSYSREPTVWPFCA